MYRAEINGKVVMLNVSADGALWHHVLGRGQVILANSDDAYQFALAHVVPEDLPHIVRRLKPSTTVAHYMGSQLVN